MPFHAIRRSRRPDRERGAALAITMIAVTALLGLGAITLLSVQSEIGSGGQSRFNQEALYAAESGVSAGMEYLRNACDPTGMLFSAQLVSGNIGAVPNPNVYGNGNATANPFTSASNLSYAVTILNNTDDKNFANATGTNLDSDGIVILHSVGTGPDGTTATIEVTVQSQACITQFCVQDYAQRGVDSSNDAYAMCSSRVTSGTLRTITPGN